MPEAPASRQHFGVEELSRTQLLAAVGVPVLVALAVYLPALRGGFIWDDPLVLQQLRALGSLGDLFVPPPIVPKFYFRPLIFISYLLDGALGGERPFWFHASVIACHALNTGLVFVFARRLFAGDWRLASAGALLFAVFPTHVESVAWMAGRSDVIVCTFVILTMLLFIEHGRAWTAWLGGAVFFCATLSKEMALACVVLVPLLDLMSRNRLYWRRYIPLALATLAYLGLRQHALGSLAGSSMPATNAGLVSDLVRALGFYGVRAVLPVGLSPYVPEVPTGATYLLAGTLLLTASVGLIALAWQRERWPVAYLIAWFLLTLAPSLAVILRRSASAVIADRYLYVPSVASCLLLAWAVWRLAHLRRIDPQWIALVIGVVSLGFAIQVVGYTQVWTDNLTFWSAVATTAPQDAMGHRELASALVERGRLAEAELELQRALAANSDAAGRVMTYGNLANLYRRMRRFDEAQQACEAGLQINPHPALYHNLGMILLAKIQEANPPEDQVAVQRDILKARDAFEHALELGSRPGAAQAFHEWEGAKTHALLGQVLFSLGDRTGARQHLQESLRLQPTGPTAEATRQYLQRTKLE